MIDGERRGRTRALLRTLFGFTAPVSRRTYLLAGLGLMALKYAVEALVVHAVTGTWWTPFDYFSPSMARFNALHSRPLAWGIAFWSLPFIWVGVSMTARRALDVGLPARLALLFFVPILNNIFMLVLAAQPTQAERFPDFPATSPMGDPAAIPLDPAVERARGGRPLRAAMLGVLVGCAIVAVAIGFGVLVLRSYSSVLFIGAPFVVGFVTASLYNGEAPRTLRATLGLTTAAVIAAAGVVLLLAFEGVLCLAMAFPLALGLSLIGAALGRAIALRGHPNHLSILLLVLALPAMMGLSSGQPPEAAEVRSDIEVNASPDVVWNDVVSFAELAPPTEWFFRAGIAFPVRARIDGTGVGAVRRCEFSTGPFVEPITVWDPPRRLSFDVRSEPPGLRELRPYDDVHAPHTAGYLRSRHGEFRLVPLPGGRTRLEGSTFYTLQIFPTWYWTPWADGVIHAIHMRVLRHIKALAEAQSSLTIRSTTVPAAAGAAAEGF